MNKYLEHVSNRGYPLIIAEIGANYGGIDIVRKMVEMAAGCGADMVKFQTYQAETISTPGSYFTFEDGSQISQFDFFKKYELNIDHHKMLDSLCRDLDIQWLSTPSHKNDLELLEPFDPPFYKTGSDDITNVRFLREIAQKGRPMLVSTGMCTLSEIEVAVEAIQEEGNTDIILLHCVVSYPADPAEANLRFIETLKRAFNLPVGLSDHTSDELTSVLATQLGVAVIEKHFTLDHTLNLPDHEASLDPEQFTRLVEKVKMVPKALGDGVKKIQSSEQKWRKAARKSLFASVDIPEGTVLCDEHIAIRRPSDGIHPHQLPFIVGRVTRRFIPAGKMITWEMV